MTLIHFTKRILECMFVHKFSKSTKSLNKLIWEMGYYWLIFGAGIGYYLFHPLYMKPFWEYYSHDSVVIYYFLLATFIICEVINLLCHTHLASFRKKDGDKRMGIPVLHGFSHVSCANYFYEILAWCIFTITT